MNTIKKTIHINAAPEKVWPVIADFPAIQTFNPSVTESYGTSTSANGIGATRHCTLTFGAIEERIIDWQEGKSYTVEIYDSAGIPPIVKNMRATVGIKAAAGGGTQASFTFNYDMAFGPIGALMNMALVKAQYAKASAGILAGLKHHVETGEEVTTFRVLKTANALIPA